MSDWLQDMLARVPYAAFLGITLERDGDGLRGLLPFSHDLIGVPQPPALHGGVTMAFLEVTALSTLMHDVSVTQGVHLTAWPRTLDLSVDYLRPGLSQDSYARASVTRAGRRYATVSVAAWQDDETRPFAQAIGHFMMPEQAS
ncbi:thioesterase superfamily protein [Ketogulonicigenium robustum]|uniref:Thioesterase superfamily protein n=1 Tax=Ketogulonicigenium robustum TaxID=92947 RepID=A0A1W6P126_9RHOB|nr:PaaI family thioesterase [Ketogulonicigenium robustum]ARO15113.1 thioesterase superfamily protein [Ketogulonicigenium robustum]